MTSTAKSLPRLCVCSFIYSYGLCTMKVPFLKDLNPNVSPMNALFEEDAGQMDVKSRFLMVFFDYHYRQTAFQVLRGHWKMSRNNGRLCFHYIMRWYTTCIQPAEAIRLRYVASKSIAVVCKALSSVYVLKALVSYVGAFGLQYNANFVDAKISFIA